MSHLFYSLFPSPPQVKTNSDKIQQAPLTTGTIQPLPLFSKIRCYMFSSCKKRLYESVINAWFGDGGWTRSLMPLSLVFNRIAKKRKAKYLSKKRWTPPVPVMVVGNITVGGTGKTPLVASLVKGLQERGYSPGVVSRGFGANTDAYPVAVTSDSDPRQVGDEPVMLAHQLQVPVIVDPDRVSAAQFLCKQYACDLIITDDGLQHYNLKRHLELLVLDGQRMLGNGLCLPAGPLREPSERLKSVDMVFSNGLPCTDPGVPYTCFNLVPQPLRPVSQGLEASANELPKACRVHGVAGIGNPERFFTTLADQGFDVIPHAFPDHYQFTGADIDFGDGLPVIMTAKDAVKCRLFAQSNHWYLPVATDLSHSVLNTIANLIEESVRIQHG